MIDSIPAFVIGFVQFGYRVGFSCRIREEISETEAVKVLRIGIRVLASGFTRFEIGKALVVGLVGWFCIILNFKSETYI